MAVSGTLIARAGFAAHLAMLGLASAIAIAALSLLTWRHGQAIYRERRRPGIPAQIQTGELRLLTAATLLIAAIAIVVTTAI